MPGEAYQSQFCRIGQLPVSLFDCLIIITSLVSVLVNLVALLMGITIVTPHFFYIPIILVAYRYPQIGVPFAVGVSALYLGMHAALAPGQDALLAAAIRVSIFLGIAVTVSYLSRTLNREKRRYRSIFDTSGAGIFLLRRDTFTIVQANRQFLALLGFAPGELEGMEIGRIWQDAYPVPEHLSTVRQSNPIADLKATFVGKDGDARCVMLSAAVMDDDLIVCTTIDITEQRRAEAKVHEREATLQAFFEGAGIGIGLCDLDGRIVESNPMLQEIMGYTCDELAGLHFGEFTHPDDVEPDRTLYRDLIEGRLDRYRVDKRNVRKDGTAIWVRKTVSLVRNVTGTPQFAIGMVEDITAGKVAEEEIRIQRDFGLQLASVCSRDEAMRLCLKTAIQVLGVDSGMIYWRDEEIGSYLLVASVNLADEYLRMVSYLPGECECAQRFANRRPLYGTSRDVSPSMVDMTRREGIRSFALLPILSRNSVVGGCFIASHTLDEVPQSVRDDLETMVAQMGNALHRILAEEELRESEARFRFLAENARDIIYRFEFQPERRFTYVSSAATVITGYSPEEYYTVPDLVLTLMHPDDRHLLTAVAEGRLSWDEPQVFRWVKKDGSVIWAELRNVPFYDDDGNLVAIEGIARDVTELKQYSEQLERSLREKEVLLKEVHHRVKNNMQVISSLMSLQAYAVDDEKLADAFRESERRVKSMALVHETLYQSEDFAHIRAADYIWTLVGELAASYAVAADIDLQIDIEDVPLELEAAIPCGLIINELVSNALKHAFRGREKGTLEVALHRTADSQIMLRIRDDGVGLPDDLDPFAPRSESLGFELVTILSRQLGGALTCERKTGTSFEITFPEQY